MNVNLLLTNALTYEDKETQVRKSRLEFIIIDKDSYSDSANYKGFSTIAVFTQDTSAFDKLTSDMFLAKASGTIVEKVDKRNPLKKRSVLSSVTINSVTIDLL